MTRASLTLSFLFLTVPAVSAPKGTALAVFAHPDDETSVGPLLARYASEGHDVYLAIATSGQVGDSNTDIPRGEALGKAREEEARCACRALGIRPPLLLGFMDGGLPERETIPRIVERIRELVNELKPDILITWGPDGLSGHPDHRIISSITTQVFQEQDKLQHRPDRLYYVAIPESVFERLPPAAASGMAGNLVSDRFVTTIVDGSSFTDQSYRAIQCHQTQWPPAAMEMMGQLTKGVLGGKVFLRLAMISAGSPGPSTADIFPRRD